MHSFTDAENINNETCAILHRFHILYIYCQYSNEMGKAQHLLQSYSFRNVEAMTNFQKSIQQIKVIKQF